MLLKLVVIARVSSDQNLATRKEQMLYAHSGRYRSPFPKRPQFNRGGNRAKVDTIDHKHYQQAAEAPEVSTPVILTHQSFAEFGLDERLLKNITAHGYKQPTMIQDQIIPLFMQGKDVVGLANTGSGKTAAFLLPIIEKILKNPNEGAMIVVPTRELATQIGDELRQFIGQLPIGHMLAVGGLSIEPQIRALRREPHFIIGTPGRLKDLFNRHAINAALYGNVVLDEVDRMLDIGFLKDVQFIIDQLPRQRQGGFFSATMTSVAERLLQSFANDPVRVKVVTERRSVQIDQSIIKIEAGQNKITVLSTLLKNPEYGKVIVFGRTKHGINKLERILAAQGHRVSAIHGNKTQNARQTALNLFKQGHVKALLATDVAARGIDVPGVTHVINYDEPNTLEDYTHRIGRTGRAGNMGKAVTFVVG